MVPAPAALIVCAQRTRTRPPQAWEGAYAPRRFDRGQGAGITVDSEAATALGDGGDIVVGVSAGVGMGNDVGIAGTRLGTVVGASVGDGIGTSGDSTEGEAVGILSQCLKQANDWLARMSPDEP